MIITDKTIEQLTKEKKLDKLTTLYLHYYNIDSFDFSNKSFSKLEFLSLQNNNITNIDFIKNLPNLWYFDVRNNPLENYESLNIKNVFGFLGLPVDKYCEKSLLQVKRLSVGILYVNLDENLKKYFLSNNPNILIYNDDLIYEFDKTIKRENMSLGVNPSLLNRRVTQECKQLKFFLFLKLNINALVPTYTFNQIGNNSFLRKTTTKAEYLIFNNSNNFSEKIINLFRFFNDLIIDSGNNPLSLINLNRDNSADSNNFINSTKNALSGNIVDSNPNYNQPESQNTNSKIFKDENNKFFIRKNTNELFSELEAEEILKKERSKLIYISRIYQSFLDLNKQPDHLYNEHSKTVLESPINYNFDMSANQSFIKKNKYTNYFNLDSLKVKDLKLQIAICTILGLYLIQVINKNICYVLLKFICNKFKLTQHDTYCIHSIKNILNLKTEILLGLYYNLIENLKSCNEFHLKNNSKIDNLLKISNSTSNIFNEEPNKGLVDLSIHKHMNTVPEANEKNPMENNIITTNNNVKDLNTKGENCDNIFNTKDSIMSENNPNFRWEEIIKVLYLENLIFNIKKISQRNNSIYQMMEQNKNEDRKKFLHFNIIKPLDEIYNLFDEALILVQYLSDYIKMNNFHDILLAEFTKDYRYFLETKDVFFQYLNNKSRKNLIYDSLTDRIFFKHKQNYLGNSIFFKLKEKKIEEKLAEHQNNLSIKKYLHDVSYENIKETKKFSNSMTNFNNGKQTLNKNIKSKASFDNFNSNFTEIKENNMKKFIDIYKSKEKAKQTKINFPQNFISKKHFFSQIKKNEKKKENMEKMKRDEEIKYDEAKKGHLKDKDIKPLIGFINREKNNRNEVEKEQTILVGNIRSRYSDAVKLLNNSERKKNLNEANNINSRSFDKTPDNLQDGMSKEKKLNNSKVKNEYFQYSQENDALDNNYNLYRTCNFLLTQIGNNENQNFNNAIKENFSENEYKLIPKKEFNKKHNNFFHNELYKVKITKNINNDQLFKNSNKIDDEVSDYLKTMKLNIGPKPSSSFNFYKRENEIDLPNKNRYSSDFIGEDNHKVAKGFNKTTQDFYPTRKNIKSYDNLMNFNQNTNKDYNNLLVFNRRIISRNSVNKDQKIQSNHQEFYLSQPDSPEKFRKSSNNFLINNVKIISNDDVINLNNFRILSPKLSYNEDLQTKNMKSLSVSIKSLKNFGDNVNLQNYNPKSETHKNNHKSISNFSSANNKNVINNANNNNPVNFINETKFDRKQKTNHPKELFRNSQNNFYNNPNKIILDRKLLKSYNRRRIKYGIDILAKDEKKDNNHLGMFGQEKEQEIKKKIKITSIFPKKEIKEKTFDKNTFLDFRSNFRKLVHRWNEKNPHSNNTDNKAVKENDFFRVLNKQKKQNLNIMSAKDIHQLFSISTKDEDIFNQIFDELEK